jgi:hypothetical protein
MQVPQPPYVIRSTNNHPHGATANLTPGEWIQIGVLVVATLGLLGGASVRTWSWIKNRRGLRVIPRLSEVDPYIHSIDVTKSGSTRVRSVATWIHLELWNNSQEAQLITGSYARYGKVQSARVLGFPVEEIGKVNGEIAARKKVRLPLSLGPKVGKTFWVLVEISVDEYLGELLFHEAERRASANCAASLAGFKKIAEQVSPAIQDVDKQTAQFGAYVGGITLGMPALIQKPDGRIEIRPIFGHLSTEVVRSVSQSSITTPKAAIESGSREALHVGVTLSDGRSVEGTIPTHKRAFWFMGERHV